MELRHLRYFVAVAEETHFGRAAVRLNTSQPSVSQQIKILERELNVSLLVRTRPRVQLTPAGRRFLEVAQGILASAEQAGAVARETARGDSRKIVLGISVTSDWDLIGKTRRRFVERAPDVKILFQNLSEESQVAALHAGEIDIGFCCFPTLSQGLTTEITGRERMMVALPAGHRFARRRTVRLEDLVDEPYSLWPRHFSPGCYDHLLNVFRNAGFGPPLDVAGDLPPARTILGMVAAGLIIALVIPEGDRARTRGFVLKQTTEPGIFHETAVIYRRGVESETLIPFLQQLRLVLAERDPNRTGRVPSRPGISRPRTANRAR
ncbi:MAG: LysR family transcriptional regulator [Acidobacteria bacterium]|nr:LysR family transcriptional regulator [Acidobacteriota bacterium]